MVTTLSFLFLGLILLFAGGESLVRGSSAIATRLHIPPLVIGVTIVGFGTSMPELLVSVSAALKGLPDIAMGNIVGSNIANVLLILGISALLLPIKQEFHSISRDFYVMVGAGFVLVGLSAFGAVNQWAGIFMVGALVVYVLIILTTSRQEPIAQTLATLPTSNWKLDLMFITIGLVCLLVGADWLVDSATVIARSFGVSEVVIGLTIVAVGTSLPELATSVVAAIKRESDIAVGNILGSNIFNILGILGVTAIVSPIDITSSMARFDIPLMFAIFLLLGTLIYYWRQISRPIGLCALAGYAGYVAYLY